MIHRLKYIAFILLCGVSIGAGAEEKSIFSQYPMHSSLILNAAVSDIRQPALGITFSRQGLIGYYANFMIGLDNIHLKSDYHIDSDGCLTDGEDAGLIPFYSGKRAYNRLSASAGFISRLVIPLFVYVGGGYGYKTETRELINAKWVETASSLGHSGIVEAGLMGHLGNFTLQAGYTLFISHPTHLLYHEAKVGIGYTFYK